MAQHDIRSLFGKTGGGDDEKTESLRLSHQAKKQYSNNATMTHTQKKTSRKREVLDKWLFCLDRLLELSYIIKNLNHIMIWCFSCHLSIILHAGNWEFN